MPLKTRDRFAYWLEQFIWLHPALLRYDGDTFRGSRRYVNRLNGHVVVK